MYTLLQNTLETLATLPLMVDLKTKIKKGKTDYSFKYDQPLFDDTDWAQRADSQPFFGQIQIHFPHRPFAKDSVNPVDPSEVVLPDYIPIIRYPEKIWPYIMKPFKLFINRLE